MSREAFEKWLRGVDAEQSLTLAADFPHYASYVTCLIAEGWLARQPEIDELRKAAQEIINIWEGKGRGDMYERVIDRLRAALEKK